MPSVNPEKRSQARYYGFMNWMFHQPYPRCTIVILRGPFHHGVLDTTGFPERISLYPPALDGARAVMRP